MVEIFQGVFLVGAQMVKGRYTSELSTIKLSSLKIRDSHLDSKRDNIKFIQLLIQM